MANQQSGVSNDTKTIVTVLLLTFVFPVGFILMWVWAPWRLWVKLLASFPFLVLFIGLFSVITLAVINPGVQIKKANCAKQCQSASNTVCMNQCLGLTLPSPTPTIKLTPSTKR